MVLDFEVKPVVRIARKLRFDLGGVEDLSTLSFLTEPSKYEEGEKFEGYEESDNVLKGYVLYGGMEYHLYFADQFERGKTVYLEWVDVERNNAHWNLFRLKPLDENLHGYVHRGTYEVDDIEVLEGHCYVLRRDQNASGGSNVRYPRKLPDVKVKVA